MFGSPVSQILNTVRAKPCFNSVLYPQHLCKVPVPASSETVVEWMDEFVNTESHVFFLPCFTAGTEVNAEKATRRGRLQRLLGCPLHFVGGLAPGGVTGRILAEGCVRTQHRSRVWGPRHGGFCSLWPRSPFP